MHDCINHESANALEWFALYVRSKYERTVGARLQEKGYETYLPVRDEVRKWADRTTVVQAPLFPNYVFCRLDIRYRMPIIVTPDVYGIVGLRSAPTPIPSEQI